jgi:hypothetical protein
MDIHSILNDDDRRIATEFINELEKNSKAWKIKLSLATLLSIFLIGFGLYSLFDKMVAMKNLPDIKQQLIPDDLSYDRKMTPDLWYLANFRKAVTILELRNRSTMFSVIDSVLAIFIFFWGVHLMVIVFFRRNLDTKKLLLVKILRGILSQVKL